MPIYDFITYFCNIIYIPVISSIWFIRVQKDTVLKKWMMFVILITSSVTSTMLNTMEILPRTLQSVLYPATIVCIVLFSSKDKFTNKIINLTIYYALMSIIDLFSYALIGLSPSIPPYIPIIVFSVLLTLSLYFSEQFIKSIRNKESNRKAWQFLLIPLSQCLILVAYGYTITIILSSHSEVVNSGKLLTGMPAVVITVSAVISLVADIIALKQYTRNLDLIHIESENRSLEYQNQLNLNYFNELKQNEDELRKIKHDINGCLEAMKEIIYTENNIDKAQQFFNELSSKLTKISTGFYCKNSLINAIIISKFKECSNQSISLNVEIILPDELNISDTDICRVLTNMLDNAIEANAKISDNRFIDLSIKDDDGYVYFSTRNSFDGNQFKGTTKSNEKEHGYGLKILREIASKYSGNYQTSAEGQILSSFIVLKNIKKQTNMSN